jgi:hypothetical protein
MQIGNTSRSSRRFSIRIPKHRRGSRRLTDMQAPIRPLAFVLARSLAMVALAVLLILVLLPAALAAQAASAV